MVYVVVHGRHRSLRRRIYKAFAGPPPPSPYRWRVIAFRWDDAEAQEIAAALEAKRRAAHRRRSRRGTT